MKAGDLVTLLDQEGYYILIEPDEAFMELVSESR